MELEELDELLEELLLEELEEEDLEELEDELLLDEDDLLDDDDDELDLDEDELELELYSYSTGSGQRIENEYSIYSILVCSDHSIAPLRIPL